MPHLSLPLRVAGLMVIAKFSLVAAALGSPEPKPTVAFTSEWQDLPLVAARGVALRDFNGDGQLDAFIVADNTPDSQGLRVYFGDGRGHLIDSGQVLAHPEVWTHPPAAADIDGDGDVDVVVGGTQWRNDGHGLFTAHDLIAGEKPPITAVGLADLDGDGCPDLMTVWQWKEGRIFLNDGRGQFRDTGERLALGPNAGSAVIATFALADVDADGSTDVVTVGWRNAAADVCPNIVWLNNGRAHFRDSGQRFDFDSHHVHGVAAGDLDGDRRPDLVFALTSRDFAGKVFLNSGGGAFRDTTQVLGEAWTHAVRLGDFDGDGALDVFLACGEPKAGTPNQIWLNDGHGQFRDTGLRLGHAFSSDAALGDLNGDGRLDVFVANLRLVDDSKMPPTFGGAPPEVWSNEAR